MGTTGGDVTWMDCGNNGTTWIQYAYKAGIALENRWLLEHGGGSQIMTVANPDNGDVIYVHGPTTGEWQTWNWFGIAASSPRKHSVKSK